MSAERRRMSRSRILQGAHEILDGGVYGDLTVDALARSLRMSKSTLYKYFASKDDVVIALVDQQAAETEDALAEIDTSRGRPDEVLARLVTVLADHADRIPRAAVLQQGRLPHACQDRLVLTQAAIGESIRAVIARGATSGSFRFDDAALAATTFMAGAQAAMQAAARGEVAGTRGHAVHSWHALMLPGLTTAEVAAAV